MEHLQAFAIGPAHRKGWDLYTATTKQNPHIGIMHETYAVPKGYWETVYLNFKPFGFGMLHSRLRAVLLTCPQVRLSISLIKAKRREGR